jgi:short subunit dehydrogenase-like uncharacterized protein
MVAQLLRRGFAPLAIGRDSAKLTESGFQESDVPIRTASIDDPSSLDRSLAGAAAVINCAGPFLDTADAVAAAALRARIHYLDITAEQASAQATFDRATGIPLTRSVSALRWIAGVRRRARGLPVSETPPGG